MEEVGWVLDQRDGRTTLIRRASAGSAFLIRAGQVVTLPQMVFLGEKLCTCYDIYKLYMDLPIFIHKRHVGRSGRPGRSPASADLPLAVPEAER